MVEGHSCHRLAFQHRKRLVGRKFAATSPNSRFSNEAAKLDGKVLQRIEVHGKNLFYFFEGALVMHIHFGMSGRFGVFSGEKAPEPGATTRLRLESSEHNIVALLSAMTLALGDEAWYEDKIKQLGPDPLREDADKERVWAKWRKTSRAVGLLLMDQSTVAGVGNIFRAEILFKAGVHPEQPANTTSRGDFERVWQHCVGCLQAGFKSGSIRTVDPAEAKSLGAAWQRRYIYNQASCGRCASNVVSWTMATRRVYCCPRCQALPPGTELTQQRQQAVQQATSSHLFPSSCARDAPEVAAGFPSKLPVRELRRLLRTRGLDARGKRDALLGRLDAHPASRPAALAGWGNRLKQRAPQREKGSAACTQEDEPPGTAQLAARVADAAEAALEKRAAGESRAVEHVAEMDDAVALALEQERRVLPKRRSQRPGRGGCDGFATPLKLPRDKRGAATAADDGPRKRPCFVNLAPSRTSPISL